jgi:predicted transport protein
MKNHIDFDVYFYAQSLDNLSRDSIYMHQESGDGIKEMDSGAERSRVLSNIAHTINSGYKLDDRITKDQVDIYVAFFEKKCRVAIKINTKNKDNMGRNSYTTVLLDGKKDFYEKEITGRVFDLINIFLEKTNRNYMQEIDQLDEMINKAISLSKKKLYFRLLNLCLIGCFIFGISFLIYVF